MRAFILALIAACIITIGSNQVLHQIAFSAQAAATSDANVRLPD